MSQTTDKTVSEFRKELDILNFEEIYHDSVYVENRLDINELMYIYFNFKTSSLIIFDSYKGEVNSATIYYNLKRTKNDDKAYSLLGSGHHIEEDVWIGERMVTFLSLTRYLEDIDKYYEYINNWIENPVMSMISDIEWNHYNETKRQEINDFRKLMLQQRVKDRIYG